MKFRLQLLNDSGKMIRQVTLRSSYSDKSIKESIAKKGTTVLNEICSIMSRSVESEALEAVRTLLGFGDESKD